jgi:hypothetical protein
MMREGVTEQGNLQEIERNFYRNIPRDVTLLAGFKCGMVDDYGDMCGVYFDDTDTGEEPGIKKQFRKHWELIGVSGWDINIITRKLI